MTTPFAFDGLREVLLQSLPQEELDEGMAPILDRVNGWPHLVSLYSCSGHGTSKTLAWLTIMVKDKQTWQNVQEFVEDIMEAGAMRLAFDAHRVGPYMRRFPGTRLTITIRTRHVPDIMDRLALLARLTDMVVCTTLLPKHESRGK